MEVDWNPWTCAMVKTIVRTITSSIMCIDTGDTSTYIIMM